ncbi:Diguanylate cyclase/phosphodiesterase with PAS/PAC and GAF sensor(S) [Acidithiobacillus ferrivorans]|uniref:Diguanylate cyclase/phosphodiesterase with PAS/PAC and GAF sensor(S) n=2 Tax=Acidithiobacillus ferrivorans TaxID=160808 RepID=A0A060UT30_9PROT|nr:Diguanylate cyclase/phosphodiesterase with PAS/PAC and GAF sensor(S) [Acidithiobacillus ferrivorans]SMH66173.1 Diguanylate cyclase/phosphodiesterase with PAS/PAC and GAF sensor(S) [Acidithiobacillus ferrivorans]
MIHRASRNRSFLTKASVPFMHLLSAFAKRPERSIHAFFVAITLLIVGFLVSNTINARNAAHAVLHGKAAETGHIVADGVALQIRAHFHDLTFLRDTFLQKGSGTLIPSAKALAVFTAFRQTHPAIIAINIQNPTGHLTVWSSQKPSFHPIIAADKAFHALQDDPTQFLGAPFFATRDQAWILPLRERLWDNDGRVLGFIGSPFLLSRMSSIKTPSMIQGVVLSLSDGKAISLWRDGHWLPPGSPLPRPVGEITTPIPGLPWIVHTQWDAVTLAHLFWENEWRYLLLTFLLLLITAATDTATQIAYARIRQLHEYQKAALHIQQSLINLRDTEEMYRLVVDTIVVKTKAIGAYVALPEAGAEWLRITAARADDTDLQQSLVQIKISLDSAHLPYGNLLPARCFREKILLGPLDPQEHAAMAEIHNGIPALRRVRSVMAYPIFLSESPDPFAVLVIESDTRHHFTPALQNLLAQMVQSVGAALTQSRDHQQLQQLTHFSVLLSSANEAIAHMENEAELLQSLCALTVQHTNIRLAWIGRPDDRGAFKSLAAAGAVDYLEDICISVSAESPDGQGAVGQSWRDQQPVYNASFTKNPHMHPWVQRAQAFGMGANASLPIYRGGKLWAVLAVYRGEERIFDADLQKILEDLAKDVGYGLDRLDILRKEREANAFNEVLLNVQTSGINVMRYPERIIERINARMLEMFEAASMEDVVDHPLREFFSEEETYAWVCAAAQTVLKEGHGTLRDVPYRRMDGGIIYMDLSGQRLDEPDGVERILWTCVDVTERHQLMGELAQQALFDMLTGLPNRRALDAELEKAMARADRHEYLLGVVMMDLDGFKLVNDTYGHEAGDLVLQRVGQHLREGVRRTDFVARLGGDEFVLLLEDCTSIEEINIAMEKIGGVVRQPIDLPNGTRAVVDLSAGMSIYPTDDINNPDTLLRYADQALYNCKSHKTDRLHFWTLYGKPVSLRLNAVQKLLRNGELLVHYQPVLDTHSHQIVGVEALARLRDEDGRILYPGEFLPLITAEDTTDLSRMVLIRALADLAGLDVLGWSLWVSFNVAQESVDDRYVRCLAGVVEASGIDSSRITLEILGGSDFLERNAALSILHDIKDLGIRLALDDVGSAYFSLLRLKVLPIDEIKLDQDFIRSLEERPQDLYFIASIRDLAFGMGVDLVVEGVETDDILDAISVMGIRLLQGYAIARPMPVAQLWEFLVQHPSYHRQHPTSLLGLYAKQVSDQGALKKVILDNPLLINSDELAEASRCAMDEHMRRLGLAENSLLFGLHWEVHRAIASLLKAPVIGDWETVKQTQKAFEGGLLEAFQKTKR